MAEAGSLGLLRRTGWLKLFRGEKSFVEGRAAADRIAPFGLKTVFYQASELQKVEPSLQGGVGAVHYLDPASVSDPLALTRSYLQLFTRRGGWFSARRRQDLSAGQRRLWRRDATGAFAGAGGGDLPRPVGGRRDRSARLRRPDGGQARLSHALRARRGGRAQPSRARRRQWLPARPHGAGRSPDHRGRIRPPRLVPDYGQLETSESSRANCCRWRNGSIRDPGWAPGPACRTCCRCWALAHATRVWFNFGHQHHGLTLAASSGRLLAEMMTGRRPSPIPRLSASSGSKIVDKTEIGSFAPARGLCFRPARRGERFCPFKSGHRP